MLWNKAVVVLGGFLLSSQLWASGSVSVIAKEIKSRDHLHALMAAKLNFPASKLNSMDSLYAVLSTDVSGGSIIKIKNVNLLRAKLGSEYVDEFVQAVMNASEDNPRIVLLIE